MNRLQYYKLRYQEPLRYVIVGGGTTVINYVLYFFLLNACSFHYIVSNILAWVVAVLFSYFANSAWVYSSTSHRCWQEALAFATSRLFTLGIETVLLFFMVELGSIGENWAKLIVAVIVGILNYIMGRFIYKREDRKGR